jgi:predicted  nucleic acid-binding Zn-ribbon protein
MEVPVAALQVLHRIHRQLADLQGRFTRGPRQVQAAEAHVKSLEEQLAHAKQLVLKTKMASDQRELQLREREARIADLRRKLNACTTNKEYQALLEQIAADEQANSVLSDEILEMLDKIQQLQQKVEDAQQHLAQGKVELQRVRARVDEEKDLLEGEIARVSTSLVTAEKELPEGFVLDYRRLVKARGADALAPLEGECCGSCYQMVTTQTVNDLMMSRPVFCKSCGAILYLPESPTR